MANHQLIINRFPVIINLAAIVRGMSGQRRNRKVIVNPFTVIVNLAVLNLSTKDRRVSQPICRQFADHSWEFADSAGTALRESTDNLPVFARNLPILAVADLRNPSIIHRRIGSTHRSGCRNRSVESSDIRQMIYGNRQIRSPMDRPSYPRNHQLIVNQIHVIINSAARNLSPIHHQTQKSITERSGHLRVDCWNHPIIIRRNGEIIRPTPRIYR